MEQAKVYFTNFETTMEENIQQKFSRLLLTAGLDQIDFENKYVAIKLHFGEPGNLAYLRPQYARTLVDLVKQLGGKPFLTDCNTLYVGGRTNGLDHLESAYQNGFNPYNMGCHVLIGDGLRGTDEVEVPVNGDYVHNARIGRAVMDADIVISLAHFKGHEGAGFGGTIKNVGMGCGSRAGKEEMHASRKPKVRTEECIGCGSCAKNCAHGAPVVEGGKMQIDLRKCLGCGRCIGVCPTQAIYCEEDASSTVLNSKMAEYTKAVVQGRPAFYINIICDVSPYCDCYGVNHPAIIPDIGMLASFDPVAIDEASGRLCNQAPRSANVTFEGNTEDIFTDLHPSTNWHVQISHGKKIGLGTDEYRLIEI